MWSAQRRKAIEQTNRQFASTLPARSTLQLRD
jgi:hypothetical protein